MYTKHFCFKILPFENVPDPAFFFDQGDHARVRKRVEDSLKAGRGLIVVTGPIGSGKTTLSQMIKSDLYHQTKLIWMALPPENSADLFMFIAEELDLKPSTSEKVFVVRDIKDALLKINAVGGKCLLIVDESHLMTDDTLNGIRLLNNLEEGPTKLIQILLLGQEELMDIINRPEMEPFKQRIATMESLGKLNADRIRKYVSHRIQVAGGDPSVMADTGWEALNLAFASNGTPRVINSLCDRSFNMAFEREKTAVDVYDVYDAAQGMGLSKEIFHYIVTLKNKERKKQEISKGENDYRKETETFSKEYAHSFSSKSDVTDKKIRSETDQAAQKTSKSSFLKTRTARKGLKRPVVYLLLFTAALILSIFLYCQGSDSAGLMSCLLELIGF